MSSYGDDKLKVRLSAAMNPSDAHAIVVKYHAISWSKNVTNVLRKCSSSEDHSEREAACVSSVATEVEFIQVLREALSQGNIYSMSTVEDVYKSIGEGNGMNASDVMSRRKLKQFIDIELEHHAQ